jgi:NitT/TauT family transport system substrate-binding protein
MLTGSPPYTAGGSETLRRQAEEGDLDEAFTRLRDCGADPELIHLAERCLAPSKEERPAAADEVAAAVSDYLAAVRERQQRERLARERLWVKVAEKRRRRSLWLALAASGVATIGLATFVLLQPAGPGRYVTSGSPPDHVLRIGLWSYPAYAPLVVAAEMNLCEGLEVRVENVGDIKKARAEMMADRIDASVCVVDAHVHTRAEGVRAKAVLRLAPSLGADGIVAKEGIDRLTDLHGRPVAFVQVEPPHFMLLALAAQTPGFNLDKVQLRSSTAEGAAQLYINGEVDAAITWEPHITEAVSRRGGRVIASTKEVPGTIVDILTVEAGYLEKHPENVAKMIRGWFRAVDILRPGHPRRGEAIKHVCRVFGEMTPFEFEQLEPLSPYSSVEENVEFFSPRDGGPSRFRALMSAAQDRWNSRYSSDFKLNVDPEAADGSAVFLGMKDDLLKEHGVKKSAQ